MEFPAHVYHGSVRICQTEDSQLRLQAEFRRQKNFIMVFRRSVLGPILFVLYMQPLSSLIKRHSLSVHLFADDIQIETSIPSQHVHGATSSVETCISGVKYWMIENKLQFNDEKTECLLIRPNKCTLNLNCISLSFGHNVISFSTTAKNLGFHFADDMRIDAHVQYICCKVYIDIRRINSIRHFSLFMQQKPCSVPLCFQN